MDNAFIDFNPRWETFRDRESKKWYGVCRQLRLNASGRTHSDLLRCIEDVLRLLVVDLIEENDFEEFMEARGVDASTIRVPTKAPKKLDIPFEIVRTQPATSALSAAPLGRACPHARHPIRWPASWMPQRANREFPRSVSRGARSSHTSLVGSKGRHVGRSNTR